ncbi:MAG: hypothetical protein SFW09_04335 [Hyphomicrobiaceae bacterium]|nr:hypothetical protein [Hyphomicrobiaceae bacterium]
MRLQGLAISAAALAAFAASPAMAGGCGRHVECYEKVRSPGIYATVARPVVVVPARQEVVTTPAVVMDRPERVVVAAGRTTVVTTPAVYGTMHRSVEVAPARAHATWLPGVYATRHRTIVVAPGGIRWQRKVDRHGRETMCKVHVAPVTRSVAEKVLIEPPRRVVHVTPAVYAHQTRTVLVREAARHHIHRPTVYAWSSRPVVVAPPQRHVVTRPLVLGVRHEQVLVRRGGMHWQPVGHRHW